MFDLNYDLFFKNISFVKGYMRGYKIIKKNRKFKFIMDLNKKLTVSKIKIFPKFYDKYLFLEGKNINLENVIRQIFITRLINLEFNKTILYFIGLSKEIAYPLPKDWINILKNDGIKINKFISTILLRIYFLIYLLQSIIVYIKVLYSTFFNPLKKNLLYEDCIYIDNIPLGNTNSLSNNNFVNWIRKNLKNKISHKNNIFTPYQKNQKKFIPDMDNIYFWDPLLSLNSRIYIFKFSIWYIRALFFGTMDLLLSQGYRSYLLSESIKAKIFSMNNTKSSFKYLFFNNSNYIYRPLWTYCAELKGAKNILFFYSTNCVKFSNTLLQKDLYGPGWQSNTWSYYYVWDKYMADYLNLAIDKPNVEIKGIVPFFDKYIDIPSEIDKNSKIITIFDVQPVRSSFFQSLHFYPYYTPEICIKFMSDILEISLDFNFVIVYKGKRSIGSNLHPKYKNFIKNINYEKFHNLPPETPAEQIIKFSNAVISMPFTSTSLIANDHKIPTCFYEPTSEILYNKLHTHGINLINNKNDLKNWLELI